MFDQLVREAASRFDLPASSVSALVRGLLLLMTDARSGGQRFVDLFRQAGLGEAFTSWFGGKEGKAISPASIESALGAPAVDRLSASSGVSRGVVSSVIAFLLPRMIGRLTPNGALPSNASLVSQVSSYLEPVVPEPVVQRPAFPGWLGWAAAAALLALGAWLWLRTPTGTIEPQLTLVNKDGKVTYSGVVRDEATQSAIVNALRATFGEANIDGGVRVDPNVRRAAWLPRLNDLFGALKKPGVEFSLYGNAISLGGWLSASDRQELNETVRGIVGTETRIDELTDAAAEAVRTANDKALSALDAIGTSGVSGDALVDAMNLAVINFSTGSDQIPADSAEVIRRSAAAIKRAPAGLKIEIGGHTDNTGDPASNMALSQNRADAVKRALLADGVSAGILTTKGYGDTRPRATNATEFGRFQNRRIEYAVIAGRP
jgi:OmpA-OmpF porin, OOP family